MALRILLSYNHRLSLKKRSKPPPPLNQRKMQSPSLFIVQPITTHLTHRQNLLNLQNLLSSITKVVKSAGLTAEYTLKPLQNCLKPTIKNVETAVEAFLGVLESGATLAIPGGWKVELSMRTLLGHPFFGTGFIVSTSHDGVSARLMGGGGITSPKEMELYLFWCLERSIVNEIRSTNGKWEQVAHSNEMWCVDKVTKRIRIEADRTGLSIITAITGGRDNREIWDGSDTGRSLQDLLRAL